MVLEVAIRGVRSGGSSAFEAAFFEAQHIVAASAGYQRWRELLHHSYGPFQAVEHHVVVPGAERSG